MTKKTVYLAGYSKLYEYRKYCIDNYGEDFNLIDPMVNISLPKDVIVETDKKMILSSDFIVAFIDKFVGSTFGTTMEMMFCKEHNKLLFIIDPSRIWRDDIWVKAHIDGAFDSIDECFNHLKNLESQNSLEKKFKFPT